VYDLFLAYARGAEAMSHAYAPFVKSVTRANLEAMGFLNRRAQAYLELPSRLGQCRTAQDLAEEQVRFWREAYEQHSESSRRMLEAWSQTPGALPRAATPNPPAGRADYIAFPQPGAARAASRARAASNGSGAGVVSS